MRIQESNSCENRHSQRFLTALKEEETVNYLWQGKKNNAA